MGQVMELDAVATPGRALGKHILLVDDQQTVREAVKLLLGLDDHTVVEAENGAEALDLFAREHFDLVITDFEMPVMKGNELASRIRQQSLNQAILMITAYPERLVGTDNPVDAVLEKPFQFSDLRRFISALVG